MLSFYFAPLAKHVFQKEEHCPITKGLHSIIGKGNILQIYLVLTTTTDKQRPAVRFQERSTKTKNVSVWQTELIKLVFVGREGIILKAAKKNYRSRKF